MIKHKEIIQGIYYIKNIVNNKVYIGSSIDIKRRWKNHLNFLKQNKHVNFYLQNAFNKYGKNNFKFDILEEGISDNNLLKREGYWMNEYKSYDNGYNLDKVNEKGIVRPSKETKQKISKALSGENHPNYGKELSEKTKQKISKSISGENNGNYGKHFSKEIKQKMSKAHKGKKLSKEHKLNLSKAHSGEKSYLAKKIIIVTPWNEEIFCHGNLIKTFNDLKEKHKFKTCLTSIRNHIKKGENNYKGWKLIF